jgi:hypothetical protein
MKEVRLELSEGQSVVQSTMATVGYILANYKRFGNEALKVANSYFYELGKSMGQKRQEEDGYRRD